MQASSSCVNLVIFEETYGENEYYPIEKVEGFSDWGDSVLFPLNIIK